MAERALTAAAARRRETPMWSQPAGSTGCRNRHSRSATRAFAPPNNGAIPSLPARLALAATLALAAGSVRAAVTANSVITPHVVNRAIVQFLQGTDVAGTYKTLYTAGANGSRCVALLSGDTTGSGTTAITTTTGKVNGVSYGTSPATNTVPVTKAERPLSVQSTDLRGTRGNGRDAP
jgi:hypothetical protein